MTVRLKTEKDIEVVRQAALLLERENTLLSSELVAARRELLQLKGQEPAQLELRLAELEQKLAAMREKIFGDSSEKRPRTRGGTNASDRAPGHGPREQKQLEIVEVVHDLDEADRLCRSCGGSLEEWEGAAETSEEIDVLERRFVVKKHIRRKWRCRCGGCIETAPLPPKLSTGARYSIDFAIEVAVGKYLDHAPLERQVRIMAREGLTTDSQTLWDQIERLARVLRPTYERLRDYVRVQPVLGADETRWRLMGPTGKDEGEATRWQVWIAQAPQAVFYDIQDSRSADAAKALLGDYAGILVCDGYSAYSALRKRGGAFTLAHCWAHVRRKYLEIESFFPDEVPKVLDLIGALYSIERDIPADPDASESRRRARDQRSRAIIAEIERWARTTHVLPESGLGKAIAYMNGLWPGLVRFLDDPRIPLDNNATERAARGPVVGRKNHYGSRSRRGTEVAALLYSLLESAKLAGVEPKQYLREATLAELRGDAARLPHELTPTA